VLARPKDFAHRARLADADVRRVEHEHRAVLGHVGRESAHAGEPRERKAVESAELERPEHVVGARRVLDGVEVIGADAVGVHDLRGLEVELPAHQPEQAVDGLVGVERGRIPGADRGEVFGLHARHGSPSWLT
jgi:hypothetical protein